MSFLPPAVFEIKAVADKAIAEFKQVNDELGKLEDQSLKAGGAIGGIDKASRVATAGLLAMGAAFAGFAALGVKEAMGAEVIMTRLNTTLKNQGLNTAKTREEIDALASSFVQLGFDDEEAAASMELLIRTTGDLTQSKTLLSMSADLARAKTVSLSEASSMLAKASMGNAKVFTQMGITLDSTLPKSQAVAKAMGELKEKLSGQAEKAAQTFTVQLQILKEEFNNAAQAIGTQLIPYLKRGMDILSNVAAFVKKNSTAFQIFGGIILTVTVALASYALTLKVITAATKAYAFIQGVAKTATAYLTGQQAALNGVMAVNPIGLVVMAVVALIGVLVIVWNKSDTFRKGVIAMAKAALNAFASIIPMVGQVGEAILKFTLRPLETLLKALSHVPGVGKYAKAGLDILNKGLDGVSDFADKAAIKAKNLAAGLDKFNKPIKIKFMDSELPDFGNGTPTPKGGGGGTPFAGQEKAVQDLKDLQEKLAEIQANFDESISEAHQKEIDARFAAQKRFNDTMRDLNKDYADKQAEIEEDHTKRLAEIDKDYYREVLDIKSDFAEKMKQINSDNAKAVESINANHFQKIAEIQKSYGEKLQSIVDKSIARLTDAFASATQTDVGKMFSDLEAAGDSSGEALVAKMKERLMSIKKLAENASALAGAGFSQTFIEQVAAMGPDAGNKLAESLLKGSPETAKEMQDLFGQLEDVSNEGVTDLAKSMNSGGKLATKALMQEYKNTQKELANALAEQNRLYQSALAEQAIKLQEALIKANEELTKALAAAKLKLEEQLAKESETYNEKLGDAEKAYNDAITKAAEMRDEAFKNAQEDLVKDIAASEKTMLDALTKLRKAFEDKLAPVKAVVTGIGSEIAGLGGQIEALIARLAGARQQYVDAQAQQNANVPSGSPSNSTSPNNSRNPSGSNINLTVTANSNATPDLIANTTLNALRFGLPLVV
jgi:hypothetical protein